MISKVKISYLVGFFPWCLHLSCVQAVISWPPHQLHPEQTADVVYGKGFGVEVNIMEKIFLSFN